MSSSDHSPIKVPKPYATKNCLSIQSFFFLPQRLFAFHKNEQFVQSSVLWLAFRHIFVAEWTWKYIFVITPGDEILHMMSPQSVCMLCDVCLQHKNIGDDSLQITFFIEHIKEQWSEDLLYWFCIGTIFFILILFCCLFCCCCCGCCGW